MPKVCVAFLWHQHQPYYKDMVTGQFAMPWVQKHGIKDYFGIAALCDMFPKVRMNINLVPSLLSQLSDYVNGTAVDPFLRLAVKPAVELTPDDKVFILNNFFMAPPNTMIFPHPRYKELYMKVKDGVKSMNQLARDFSEQEMRDIQCWCNLAWFHPLVVEGDKGISALRSKQRNFTEDDKLYIASKIQHVLSQVIPLHRRLQEEGRIEVSTTPFYHPILPLLCNMESARIAMPEVKLPLGDFDFCVDADAQLKKAAEYHSSVFGVQPAGLWPSEGSVSPEILPLVVKNGFKWMATDEYNLYRSLGAGVSRGQNGEMEWPGLLYRPYKIKTEGGALTMIFRDRFLSDMFGFNYQRFEPAKAVEDFISRIKAVGNSSSDEAPLLVSVILDGENAWEHYPNNGIEMFKTLFERLSSEPGIESVRICDYLKKYPAACGTLDKLHSGSWINSDFHVWIGDSEDVEAWTCLRKTREALEEAARSKPKCAPDVARAWESLYAAEGSDWFWWFGSEHFTPLAMEFDALFRRHLMNVYSFLGQDIPSFLYQPIKRAAVTRSAVTSPTGALDIRLDGKDSDYFEWVSAGSYLCQLDKSVMERGEIGLFKQVFFGFSKESFFLRLDPFKPLRESLPDDVTVQAVFSKPRHKKILIKDLKKEPSYCIISREPEACSESLYSIAAQEVIELSCPFEKLGFVSGDLVEFCIELKRNDAVIERMPSQVMLGFRIPSPDFDIVNWQV